MKASHILKSAILPSLFVSCQKTEKPNIIFFLIDDFGWSDTGVAYGEEVYPTNLRHNTPNIQALASEGAILSSAYVCPVSSPTRTSMLSGMHAAHTGITNFTASLKNTYSDGSIPAENGLNIESGITDTLPGALLHPEWTINGLQPDIHSADTLQHCLKITPFPEILRDNGYFTIHVGKAHWAPNCTPGSSPRNMGFVVNVSGTGCGKPRSYFSEDNYGNTPEKWNYFAVQNMTEYYQSGVHLTEALTLEALKTLDYPISQKQPFYLYMSHYATHTPIMGDPRFYQKYRDMGMDEGQAKYAALTEGVDKSLGDIMSYLKEKKVDKNTIIILMADNGGNSIVKAKGGLPHTQNSPLREGKGSCYEGGIRVPMTVVWPGHIAPSTRINTPVESQDIFPTILEMAGIEKYTTLQPIDGKSIVRLLTKGSKYVYNQKFNNQKESFEFEIPASVSGIDPSRVIIEHYPHQWKATRNNDIDYMSSIRQGDWKLVYRMRTKTLELYNLKEDISESNNIISLHCDIAQNLAKILSDKLREWNSPMPYELDSTQVKYPDEI